MNGELALAVVVEVQDGVVVAVNNGNGVIK